MEKAKLSCIIKDLREKKTDTQDIEVKESVEKLPSSIVETLSAFSNGSGGIIILGVSEKANFVPASGFDAKRTADALAQACSDKLTPPVRASIEILDFEQAKVVVGCVEEMAPRDKPCYVTERGTYKGSYIRAFDGDRKLSAYEIDRLLEDKSQPRFDSEIVSEASIEDLDKELLLAVIARQKKLHPRVFGSESNDEIMTDLRIAAYEEGKLKPTLAGLLALGTYPQKYFPRLTVTFTAYAGVDKSKEGSVKFLDNEKMAGSIPAIIADTVSAIRRNMRTGGIMEGILRKDVPDYPEAAIREAVCNALLHRDYSPLARGTQVQVNLYADRLEFLSPGGLYGTVTIETIGEAGYSSTRNEYLADILESTPFEGGFVAENRGTGYKLMKQELAAIGAPEPAVKDTISMFILTFKKRPELALQEGSSDDVLSYLLLHSPCSASDIAAALNIPRSTLNYRLKKLINDGVVERIGAERSRNQMYKICQ